MAVKPDGTLHRRADRTCRRPARPGPRSWPTTAPPKGSTLEESVAYADSHQRPADARGGRLPGGGQPRDPPGRARPQAGLAGRAVGEGARRPAAAAADRPDARRRERRRRRRPDAGGRDEGAAVRRASSAAFAAARGRRRGRARRRRARSARSSSPTSTRPSCPGPDWVRVCARGWRASAAATWRPIDGHAAPLLRADRVASRSSPATRSSATSTTARAGRARAGARLRGPRHRPAVPGVRRAATSATASASPSGTSSPACRPASAATPAAAGARAMVAHASQLARRARRPERRGRGDGRADRVRRRTPRCAPVTGGDDGRRPRRRHARPADRRRAAPRSRPRRTARSSSPPSYPQQRRLARELGADVVVRRPASSPALVRRVDRLDGLRRPAHRRAPTSCSTASASSESIAAGAARSSPRAARSCWSACPADVDARPHRRCGTARSQLVGALRLRRRDDFDGRGARSSSPSSPPTLGRAGHAPPTRSTTTPTRSRTPPTPAAAAPSRSPSTSAREGAEPLMPRPGFVLDVDRSTPPILFWRGEGFSLEKLPAGRSRVIYPPEPLDAARRHRRRHPPRAAQPDRPGSAAGAAVPRA